MTPISVDAVQPAPPAARELEWLQLSWWRPVWELREGGQVRLAVRRAHWYGGEMLADIGGSAWRCKSHGLFELQMLRADADQPEMSFRPHFWHADEDTERLQLSHWRGDGPIVRADGRRWFWRQHGLFRDRYWEVLDDRDRTIVTIRRRRRPFRIEGTARIETEIAPEEGLHATVFGWYLLLRETAHRRHGAH
jgi:hypothetical protein